MSILAKDMFPEGIKFTTMHWGPFIMGVRLPKHFQEELLERGSKTKIDARKELAGHLQNEFNYTVDDRQWFMEMTAELFITYRRAHEEHFGLHNWLKEKGLGQGPMGDTFGVEQHLADLWINFMEAGDFNPPHIHSGNVSFVTFLTLPEWKDERVNHIGNSAAPGTLCFQNELNEHIGTTWKVTERQIEPIVGDMWIFPARLHHQVYPYKTPGTRTSVSGNIFYVNQKDFPKDYF